MSVMLVRAKELATKPGATGPTANPPELRIGYVTSRAPWETVAQGSSEKAIKNALKKLMI